MSDELLFRFSINQLPEGKAVTAHEVEQELLEKIAASGGMCIDSLWNLAILYQRTGHLDQAIYCMQCVLHLTGDVETLGAIYLSLGQLEESRSDYASAAQCYREALALEPCSTPTWYLIHNNLGFSLNQLGDFAAAVPVLQHALKIDPNRPNAYKNLALSQVGLGNLQEAVELFIAATQANATDARSLNHLLALVDEHPTLLKEIPTLCERIEACHRAVQVASEHQPNFNAHWEKLRSEQKPD
jgi:tetratricopeptide (TPR) repeat protein